MSSRIRTLAMIGIFAALSYVTTLLIRPTFNEFLTFDFKDTVIGIAGLVIGPLGAVALSLTVSILEMFISGTGLVGVIMNVASTLAFVGPIALMYARKPSVNAVAIGTAIGIIAMTAVMLLLNYLITPIYQGVPREIVAGMLIPVFLPFNLLKASMNGVLILLLYRPVVRGLSAVGLNKKE